jgi:hypothetical protein
MLTKERELLRQALEALHFDLSAKESAKVAEEIRAFLAAESEADKPVAWTNYDELDCLKEDVTCYMYAEPWGDRQIPLYTRPEPARKPMTEEEIEEICDTREFDQIQGGMREAFYLGIRYAEKHLGIVRDQDA